MRTNEICTPDCVSALASGGLGRSCRPIPADGLARKPAIRWAGGENGFPSEVGSFDPAAKRLPQIGRNGVPVEQVMLFDLRLRRGVKHHEIRVVSFSDSTLAGIATRQARR